MAAQGTGRRNGSGSTDRRNDPPNPPNGPRNDGPRGGGGGGGGGGGNGGRGGRGGGVGSLLNIAGQLSHPLRQARRDMRSIYNPQIRGLKQDYNRYSNQMGALYDILGRRLGEVGEPAAANIAQVQGDYTSGVGGILDMIGSKIQTPEQAAFLNTLGAQSIAGADALGTQGANEQRLNASFGRQAALESNTLQRNAAYDLREGLSSLRDQRRMDTRSRLDELRAQAFERMLAIKEYQLRAAAAADARNSNGFLANFAGSLAGLGLDGAGGPPRGGPGPSNPNPNNGGPDRPPRPNNPYWGVGVT